MLHTRTTSATPPQFGGAHFVGNAMTLNNMGKCPKCPTGILVQSKNHRGFECTECGGPGDRMFI